MIRYGAADGIPRYESEGTKVTQKSLSGFCKARDWLVCIDSDGTAMDTMTVKHQKVLGPCLIEEWNLEQWREEILARWDEINMYTSTRGIHRFQGLRRALKEIHEKYVPIEGIYCFDNWCETESTLSNATLKAELERSGNVCLKKALHWASMVNERVESLKIEEKQPFEGFREALERAAGQADIAVVSSANPEAVFTEWGYYRLLDHVDVVCAQDCGSKEYCIGQLKNKGYESTHILVCGDALGDLDATEKNQALFYPVCQGREKESWGEFEEGFQRFLAGTYEGGYYEEKKERFKKNLS
ncbi:hypothetical protein C808_03669 [Lachnospiraceae bacterium M18-1]|nr:hypothetical protein C808_03669 [Lachnospiraceae bacterium M18-1]